MENIMVLTVVAILIGAAFCAGRLTAPEPEKPSAIFEVPESVSDLLPTVRLLVAAHDEFDMSGEAKRHQVLARTMKMHQGAKESDIAMAIELAVRWI